MGESEVWRELDKQSLALKSLAVAFDRYPEDSLLEATWQREARLKAEEGGEKAAPEVEEKWRHAVIACWWGCVVIAVGRLAKYIIKVYASILKYIKLDWSI